MKGTHLGSIPAIHLVLERVIKHDEPALHKRTGLAATVRRRPARSQPAAATWHVDAVVQSQLRVGRAGMRAHLGMGIDQVAIAQQSSSNRGSGGGSHAAISAAISAGSAAVIISRASAHVHSRRHERDLRLQRLIRRIRHPSLGD